MTAPPPAPPAPPGLLSSTEPLSTVYDVALLDLDGVVYLGGTAIPSAAAALKKAVAAGQRLAFVTNNAYRTPAAIAAQLTGLGVPASPEDVVTSAQAAARLLAERLAPGTPVLVIGGAGLRIAVRERGLRPVTVAAARPAAVVQGYSPDIGYAHLAEGALAIEAGALFVASNADRTLPTPRGRQPGNGALIQVIATATGSGRWSRASRSLRCTPSPSSAPGRGGRSWSATGSTPTSRAHGGSVRTACSC